MKHGGARDSGREGDDKVYTVGNEKRKEARKQCGSSGSERKPGAESGGRRRQEQTITRGWRRMDGTERKESGRRTMI